MANLAARTLLLPSVYPEADKGSRNHVVIAVRRIREEYPYSGPAVLVVSTELTATRYEPARFRGIREPNAHLAALAFQNLVIHNIWAAAAPHAWTQCHIDPDARMDPNIILDRYTKVQKRFKTLDLPDWEDIRVAVQLEAAKAQAARKATVMLGGDRVVGAKPVEPPAVLLAMLSATDIARYINQPVGRVETFLRRFREKKPDCAEPVNNPRRGEPHYLYRVADVWPMIQEKLKSWSKLTDD
jgi:hypothetical protein